MPMFYTPKPRQFRYQPRFYDPEKERWEALKQKYADERALKEALEAAENNGTTQISSDTTGATDDKDLEYFERRVREMEREKHERKSGLTWKDLFRKREMPTFNYQPRFSSSENDTPTDTTAEQGAMARVEAYKKRTLKIKRRYDISDDDYMKPMPAGRIMLYALLVCILLYLVIF